MRSDDESRDLDRIEQLMQRATGDGRLSEKAFLRRLIHELGEFPPPDLSPASLLDMVLRRGPLLRRAQERLEALGVPLRHLADGSRRGDWVVRAVPGTGDIGHVAVVASDDLLTEQTIAAEGIDADSTQPGRYVLVMEVGAFPHGRSQPFARRLLDGQGRVVPHTVVLRPNYPHATTADAYAGEQPENEDKR